MATQRLQSRKWDRFRSPKSLEPGLQDAPPTMKPLMSQATGRWEGTGLRHCDTGGGPWGLPHRIAIPQRARVFPGVIAIGDNSETSVVSPREVTLRMPCGTSGHTYEDSCVHTASQTVPPGPPAASQGA